MTESYAITFDEVKPHPRRRALILAGANLIYAVGLLVSAWILHLPPARWQRPYGGLVETLWWLSWVASPGLLAASILSLIGERVRSAPWVFRVLLAAAVVLVVAIAAWLYVEYTPRPYQGLDRWDCGSSGQSC